MTNGQAKVLRKLRQKGSRGVTFDDFPAGFALRSRISELRLNNDIHTITEKTKTSYRARYFLISEGRKAA